MSLIRGGEKDVETIEVTAFTKQLNTMEEVTPQSVFKQLKEDSKVRLKVKEDLKLPIILAFNLSQEQKDQLLKIFPPAMVELKQPEQDGFKVNGCRLKLCMGDGTTHGNREEFRLPNV